MTTDSPELSLGPMPQHPLDAPAWVDTLCPAPTKRIPDITYPMFYSEHQDYARISAKVPRGLRMDAGELESAVATLYADIFATLEDLNAPHPIRIWNGIPNIVERMIPPHGEGLDWESECATATLRFDRYMAFNAGRCAAFYARFGHGPRLKEFTPSASGVGCGGEDVVVHALACAQAGEAIENPRQIPAYKYSHQFGPRPPVFARGTWHREQLLVSGTASVLGELTAHPMDLELQFDETIKNLEHLHKAANLSLQHFHDIRVYVVRQQDMDWVEQACRSAFPELQSLELVHAGLCRPDLLVEIEGVSTPN